MPFVAVSDFNLVRAARQHDLHAWDSLLHRHQLPLYSYTAELLRDETVALDIVQETFAAAVGHLDGLRDDTKFASWLFGIAHQKCVQHWRRARRDADVFTDPVEPPADWPDGDGIDPCAMLLRQEQADELFALVAQLPAAQRSALLLHVLEDFSLEEIADITDVPLGTVKSRLHHAKRALRQLLGACRTC
jgi:RNA polymerase sigma-70 factor (ECF subfamily)